MPVLTQPAPCKIATLQTFIVSSPIGNFVGTCCQIGLHSLGQVGVNDENFKPDLSSKVKLLSSTPYSSVDYPLVGECTDWLVKYFTETPDLLATYKRPRICVWGKGAEGSFTWKVWETLANQIGPGQTVSYGKLAELAGHPNAARAVGGAMKNNPFMLIVPCHRVIKSDGKLGRYPNGERDTVKKWLLQHEGYLQTKAG